MPLKPKIRNVILKSLELAGSYRPLTVAEREAVSFEPVAFLGDKPRSAGPDFHQFRLEYRIVRKPLPVSRLCYTPTGIGWANGVLHEKFSLRSPSIHEAFSRPSPRKCETIPRGTVVQTITPYTYGDWVAEFVFALVVALPLDSPLLVPRQLMAKSYVRRDLAQLAVDVIEVKHPYLIEEATVLPQNRPDDFFSVAEVDAFLKAFHISPPEPRPGSIVYISRRGETSEIATVNRTYPNERIEKVLAELGVTIVHAKQTSQEQFQALATEADTVIGDHGSAMFNMLWWKPKRVIELFTNSHWQPSFQMLAHAMGIDKYALVDVDDFQADEFRQKIVGLLHTLQ